MIQLSDPELFHCPFIMMTEVGNIYLDEVAQHLVCPKRECRHVGVRITVLKDEETSGFVGGMP